MIFFYIESSLVINLQLVILSLQLNSSMLLAR
uniref:Uncharacterized protein n=1 Tax=Arsenophonus endosymbiont of Trialeurodes vaporariorum TaxID=235567 RepID=A0A3B0MFK8_9GAMM